VTTRNPCIVPFCPRTSGKWQNCEWICAVHWRMTRRETRLAFFRARRKQRWTVHQYLWRKLKTQAIEAAGGIG